MPHKTLGASLVPWTSGYQLDTDMFRSHIDRQIEEGMDHLYVFGTAGEGASVTDDQFVSVSSVFADQTRKRGIEPMVGVINLSMGTMVSRIEVARSLGVRRFQISMPSWAALTDDEMMDFFGEVLSGFPDCEFLHYNVARAKRQLTAAEYAVLASRHPNLVATKQSTDSMKQISALMAAAPQLRHYFVDGGYGYASLFGDCGLIPSLANCHPERLREYVAAGTAREIDGLLRFQTDLWSLVDGLLSVTPGPRRIDGAYEKLILGLTMADFPLRLLPPYSGFSDEDRMAFASWIDTNLPHWSLRTD